MRNSVVRPFDRNTNKKSMTEFTLSKLVTTRTSLAHMPVSSLMARQRRGSFAHEAKNFKADQAINSKKSLFSRKNSNNIAKKPVTAPKVSMKKPFQTKSGSVASVSRKSVVSRSSSRQID